MSILKSAVSFMGDVIDEGMGAVRKIGMPRNEGAALNRMQSEAKDIIGGRLSLSAKDIEAMSFEDMLTRASGDTNLSRFGQEVQDIGAEGGTLSREGMESMMKNLEDTGNMYAGFSRASATASPSGIVRGIGGEGNKLENAGGILAMAAMAGGANAMMGGDFSTGAGVGLAGGLGMRGLAKGFASSMGEIEGIAMKRMLGESNMAKATDADFSVGKDTLLRDIPTDVQSKVTMGQVTGRKNNPGETVADFLSGGSSDRATKMRGSRKTTADYTSGALGEGGARKRNLQAVQNLTDDELKEAGVGMKRMQKMMDPNKSKNTAINNRMLTMGGAMLSGVAFTGQSDKRNYRRGFNAHRGNRI